MAKIDRNISKDKELVSGASQVDATDVLDITYKP